MSFFTRGLFVVGGIIVGTTAINYFVLGNTADFGMPDSRLGAWREAKVRPACYPALEFPEQNSARPVLPYGQHRIARQDYTRMVEMTAALNCYVETQNDAVCEPNNRAYVVNYIEKYFKKMDDMMEAAKRYGDDEVRNVRDLWNSENNKAIIAALETHIRFGRIKKSDFGWSAPAALESLFDKYANAPDYCDKEHPWVAVKM
jgi:hypothetical protein